jgi:hypothetical protein
MGHLITNGTVKTIVVLKGLTGKTHLFVCSKAGDQLLFNLTVLGHHDLRASF